MSKKLKKRLIRIIATTILYAVVIIFDLIFDLKNVIASPKVGWLLPFGLYLGIYLLISYDILRKAFKNIIHGQIFDENFLMIVATFGAFAIQEFKEAVAVMLFYQVGEFFQDYAIGRSRKSISDLMDLRQDYANLIKDNQIEVVDPELVEVGDIIRILPGEKIPLDGIIISGKTSIDSKALTGESLPVDVEEGSRVISGTINISSSIDVKAEKAYEDSAVSKILNLVENATSSKSKPEKFITKFAKWYTPIVVISAVLLALIGSLVDMEHYLTWIERALNFLVVSCPCALVISVPLSFFTSIGRASKYGILIKGSVHLENFNKVKTFIFDKTGTLTKGNFVVSKVYPEENRDYILHLASQAESQSNHPIAKSIIEAYGKSLDSNYSIENIAGLGIIAKNEESTIYCGNYKLMKKHHFDVEEVDEAGTIIYVAENDKYLGYILIQDQIKDSSKDVVTYLNNEGCEVVLLSGDNEKVTSSIASKVGITNYRASLLPQDKVEVVEGLINNSSNLVSFVGDGINDAPVIARSDVGISMGGVGSDAAIEASDIVLMYDDLSYLVKTKKIAKKTMLIVNENIYFALLVKIAILILSIFGLASIWLAVFGDVGVALLCVLNAMRAGRIKE